MGLITYSFTIVIHQTNIYLLGAHRGEQVTYHVPWSWHGAGSCGQTVNKQLTRLLLPLSPGFSPLHSSRAPGWISSFSAPLPVTGRVPQAAAAVLLKEERRSFVPGLCTLGFPSRKSFSQKSTCLPTHLSTFSEVVPPNQTFCLLCFIFTLTEWIYFYIPLESVS